MVSDFSDEVKKRMSEGWKKEDQAKEPAPEPKKEEQAHSEEMPEANFIQLIFSLSTQAFINLGEAPNPFTNKVETDLAQAKFLIDTLGVLKDKTKNNLSVDETKFLDEVLHELMTRFVAKSTII